MTHGKWLSMFLGAIVLGGCGAPEPDTGTVSGTLTYRERIMLTPEAVLTVTLEDVSLADAPSKVIAQREIVNPGAPPIAFELEYPLDAIDERMTYSVRAQVHDRGQLVFTSDTHAPVLTRGAGNSVDLLLVGTVRQPTVSPSIPPERAASSPTVASAADNRLPGMFRYMADAPLFRDCRSNKVFPVAMEGAYKELESAYLNSGIEPGAELMVDIEGRFLARPGVGNARNIQLIVDSFTAIYPERSCEEMVDESLLNNYWKLVEVGGVAVVTPEGQREAHMILATGEDARVHGNAGCNNFFGGYETEGDRVTFGRLGSTMMACPEGMDTERAFLAALESADRYLVEGQTMTLYAGDEVVARFEVVHL